MIGHDGAQLGVMSIGDAVQLAESRGFDLVEVNPNGDPPVTKIVDYGKLIYEKQKQLRKAQSQSKKTAEIKGIRLSVKIGEHDLLTRVKAGQKFLEKGDKLKLEIILRGREKAHPEIAEKVMLKYIELLDADTVIEQHLKRMGGRLHMVVALKK